jgi:hypothetical protein
MDILQMLNIKNRQIENDIASRIAAHQLAIAVRKPGCLNLNLLGVGDSWFDYPIDGAILGPRTDVLAQIPGVSLLPPDILSLAHFGLTSTEEMGYARQKRIVEVLKDPRNGKFDGILVSAGGNDIAGDALCIWLNDARTVNGDYGQAINVPRYDGMLKTIIAAYLDLIAIRDEFLPGAPIFVHSYDYPVVDGRGVCAIGPWLKPSFDYCGWTDQAKCGSVLGAMMRMFDARLEMLVPGVIHVKTLGTVAANQWANELHPNVDGFKLIAAKFSIALTAQFPGRV